MMVLSVFHRIQSSSASRRTAGASGVVRAVLVDAGAEAGRAELEGHRLRRVSDTGTETRSPTFRTMDFKSAFR